MEKQDRINRYFFITGVTLVLLGALEPVEGAILIGIGSLLLTLGAYREGDVQWKFFMIAFSMIAVGVGFLFYWSSLGGFGGSSNLPGWYGLLILPYPIGWAMNMILLVGRIYKRRRATTQA